MQFPVTFLAFMAATSSAFVMDTYSGPNCQGSSQNVNVYDNTCATWPNGFQSFRLRTFGGNHQHAYFFGPDNCGSLPGAIEKGYVDSTTFDYKIGECHSFNHASANAVASYYG